MIYLYRRTLFRQHQSHVHCRPFLQAVIASKEKYFLIFTYLIYSYVVNIGIIILPFEFLRKTKRLQRLLLHLTAFPFYESKSISNGYISSNGRSFLLKQNVIFLFCYKLSYDLPFRMASAFSGFHYIHLPLRRLHYQNLDLSEILYLYETLPVFHW